MTRRFSNAGFRFFVRQFVLFVALVSATLVPTTFAQPPRGRDDGRPIPSDRYYRGVQYLESGDFTAAADFYQTELKQGVRLGTEQWIDSICYYAMIGESCYQAGALDDALKNYNASLTIWLSYPNWLTRVTYTGGVSTSAKPAAPWGPSARTCPLGVFPTRATIVTGDPVTEERLKQGGLISQPKAQPIDPAEILRCVALSIRRRTEILGPLAPFDPTSEQILTACSNRAVPPNHWSVTWLDVLRGLALAQSGKTSEAQTALGEALLMGGQYDHNLTGAALFELGNLYLQNGKVREAADCYYEASISAFHFGDYLLVEESIRNYSNAKKALRRGGDDPVVGLAFRWAKTRKSALLSASFGLELVEELIYDGKIKLATNGLASVDATMKTTVGRGLRTSRAADRWNYLNALLFYSAGKIADGDAALAKVVEGSKLRSTWARQLTRLDNYVKNGLSSNGALTPRNAADLYDYLLREPTAVDWAFRPTESLSIQMIAPPAAFERWFRLLFERDLKNKAFEVAERIRRERFFATQTYGGRLVSLRYILMADEALTTTSIRATRQNLLLEYPRFEETIRASKAIVDELNALPTVPPNEATKKRQTELFAELDAVSTEQEALLRLIAAGRIRIPYVFPPVLSVETVQRRLPPETAILAFLDAEGETFGFMIGKENLDSWRVGATASVGDAVATFLKTLGCLDGTRQVAAVDLSEARWKSQGARLREIVLGASDVDADRFNIVFSKLVVVPDSVLWYLPFEALCLPAIAAQAPDAPAPNEPNAPNPDDDVRAPNAASDQTPSDDSPVPDDAPTDEEFEELDSGYDSDDSDVADVETEEIPQDAPQDAEKTEEAAPNVDDETLAESADEEPITESKIERQDATSVATPRKSRSARERERLDALENALIPMIQANGLTLRYSATVGTALPNALGRNSFVETTVVGGATYPKQTPETLDAALTRFSQAVSKTEATKTGALEEIPGALYAARLKRLVVWDEILGDVWNWEPVVPGETRRGNLASDWILAPWGAPRLLVLPALRTPAESALKNGGNGSELFFPILAAQASGADAILLSRWRVGGRSAFDLTTDFVANYEKEPVADAWKNAVAALRERDVVVDEEPRLRKLGRSEGTPKYDAPFWWAGYLLVDSGEAVRADELERFDAENVAKMTAENAALGAAPLDPNAPQAPQNVDANPTASGAPTATADENDEATGKNGETNGDATGEIGEIGETPSETNAVVPRIVAPQTPPSEDAATEKPFDLEPRAVQDADLEKSDDEGDDFFGGDASNEPEASSQAPQTSAAPPKTSATPPKTSAAPQTPETPK